MEKSTIEVDSVNAACVLIPLKDHLNHNGDGHAQAGDTALNPAPVVVDLSCGADPVVDSAVAGLVNGTKTANPVISKAGNDYISMPPPPMVALGEYLVY